MTKLTGITKNENPLYRRWLILCGSRIRSSTRERAGEGRGGVGGTMLTKIFQLVSKQVTNYLVYTMRTPTCGR